MKVSQYGLHFIAQREGTELAEYRDKAGKLTIGVGHLLRPGERYPNGITLAQALALLACDIASVEREINGAVKTPLSQNEFDACASLTFNIGDGGFDGSTVHRLIDAGNFQGAADAFLMWDKRRPAPGELVKDETTGAMREPRPGELVADDGLLARRKLERALFLTAGEPDAD